MNTADNFCHVVIVKLDSLITKEASKFKRNNLIELI